MKRSEENGRNDDDESTRSPPRNRPRVSDNINGASHLQLISSSPQQQMDDDDDDESTRPRLASQSPFCEPSQVSPRESPPPPLQHSNSGPALVGPSTPSHPSSSSSSPPRNRPRLSGNTDGVSQSLPLPTSPPPLEHTNSAPTLEHPSTPRWKYTSPLLRWTHAQAAQLRPLILKHLSSDDIGAFVDKEKILSTLTPQSSDTDGPTSPPRLSASNVDPFDDEWNTHLNNLIRNLSITNGESLSHPLSQPPRIRQPPAPPSPPSSPNSAPVLAGSSISNGASLSQLSQPSQVPVPQPPAPPLSSPNSVPVLASPSTSNQERTPSSNAERAQRCPCNTGQCPCYVCRIAHNIHRRLLNQATDDVPLNADYNDLPPHDASILTTLLPHLLALADLNLQINELQREQNGDDADDDIEVLYTCRTRDECLAVDVVFGSSDDDNAYEHDDNNDVSLMVGEDQDLEIAGLELMDRDSPEEHPEPPRG